MPSNVSQQPTFRLLLQATEELVREKGCNGTTLKEIMDRTGLSKGAIYHYVRSKDELLGLLLKAQVEETNRRFWDAARSGSPELEKPLEAIASSLRYIADDQDIGNKIFVYLLGRKEDPSVHGVLQEYYRFNEEMSARWIRAGQEHGVINGELNPVDASGAFISFAYGIRALAMIDPKKADRMLEEYFRFMFETLSPAPGQGQGFPVKERSGDTTVRQSDERTGGKAKKLKKGKKAKNG